MLIENLCQTYNTTANSFHILGHALGAHIAGYAGKHLNGTLKHITGLDPAGPYFEGLNQTAARLWPTDAAFVEAIHTDTLHINDKKGFGMEEPCADVDIYPNGGRAQPGCNLESFFSIWVEGLLNGYSMAN